jgi:Na+-transporting NADH:ubiquinone oxidoreductase subunit A
MIKIKKGLDLPIKGAPNQDVIEEKNVTKVALVGDDYWWFKPTMAVKEGDQVKKGQLLFTCKRGEGIRFTAPASGTVSAVNRGARRLFESLVIDVQDNESVSFENYKGSDISSYSKEDAQKLLVESGLWTSFRTRPYSFISRLDEKPSAVFVTAMDTNPLSFDPSIVIKEHSDSFKNGLKVISKFAPVYVCSAPKSGIDANVEGVIHEEFSGPHPAGNVGTHIHNLCPVGGEKKVWHVGYQDLIAIGKLFESGEIFTDRVVALSGPMVRNPRLIKTRLGASLCEITKDEFYPFGDTRVISGSVFNGRNAKGSFCYLGKYHNQITVLKEGVEREFLGWHSPGFNKFSVKPIYLSNLIQQIFPKRKFSFTTTTNGSARSLVPIGSFEKVMPLDIFPTHLLKALLSGDTESAQQLGCMELDEEDLALCTFVDPCKHEFGPVLRTNLERILKEG